MKRNQVADLGCMARGARYITDLFNELKVEELDF